MENTPFLRAKLITPEIPDRVLYSRRLKKLDIAGHRAVFITAPAGFGKTTATMLSLQKCRDNVHWYRLEKDDTYLQIFYTHLIDTLLNQPHDNLNESVRGLESIGSISEEYSLLNALICHDAWTIFAHLVEPVYLVFDDFQNVSENSAITESVRYFINNMPPSVRVIVISRTDTGIADGKLALNSDLLHIDQNALRFTKEDIEKLTVDIYKKKMSSDDIDLIHTQTEGWITGITMINSSTGLNALDRSRTSAIDDSNEQSMVKYLLSEVLNRLNPELGWKLAMMSILPDFTCEQLTQIFGIENAEEIVLWLEKNNMFIQKFKTTPPGYRFHSLFRSALQSVLTDKYTQEEIEKMYINTAFYYKKQRDFKKAIEFLLLANRNDEALEIASVEGVLCMDAGDTNGVTSILQPFSEEMIQNNSYLLFLRGRSLFSSEFDQSYTYLHRAFLCFRQSGDYILQMKTLGMMLAISFQRNDMKNIHGIVSQIPKFKAVTRSKYARVTLLMSGFMGAAWADKLTLAKVLNKIIRRLGSYEQLWDYTLKLAEGIVLYRKGDLKPAGEIVTQILNHPTAVINDQWRSIGLALSHAITSLRRDIAASQRIYSEMDAIGEKYNSDYARGHAQRAAAHMKYQTLDCSGAVIHLEQAVVTFFRADMPAMAYATQMNRYLWEVDRSSAELLAKKSFEDLCHLVRLKPGQGQLEMCQTIMGAIYNESGNYEEAEKLLLIAYKKSKSKKALQSMCGTAMHLADLYMRKKDCKLEEKYLQVFGKISSDNDYIYFLEMNYAVLIRVCSRCIEKNIYADHMKRIISIYFGAEAVSRLIKNQEHTVSDLKMQTVTEQKTHETPKHIVIKLFGSFKMSVDGMDIDENEWKTRKISGILKYILVNPQKSVSREVLSSVFWPESDAKAASTSLRVALYELRKTLTKVGLSFESKNALLTEDKNGFRLCSGNTIETDVDIFTASYKKYKSGKVTAENAKTLLIEMYDIYKGDFLENDQYDEWVTYSREQYMSIFIEITHKLVNLYLKDGENELAETLLERLMKTDPYDEKACAALINIYKLTGRKNQAASLHRQFEKRFESEMGAKPDLSLS